MCAACGANYARKCPGGGKASQLGEKGLPPSWGSVKDAAPWFWKAGTGKGETAFSVSVVPAKQIEIAENRIWDKGPEVADPGLILKQTT
jgi:hypothetical protein